MEVVVDTSALLAVGLNEPPKARMIELTDGVDLISPSVLPFEIGNALAAMVKRGRIAPAAATEVWDKLALAPIERVNVDVRAAVMLATSKGIYAYDAYFLHAAIRHQCPLLTLDQPMARLAKELSITVME